MDIIFHAAWGATIIRKDPQVWWAALFGHFFPPANLGYQNFYPFSDFYFRFGKNWWQNRWISAVNWGVLVVVNIIIFL